MACLLMIDALFLRWEGKKSGVKVNDVGSVCKVSFPHAFAERLFATLDTSYDRSGLLPVTHAGFANRGGLSKKKKRFQIFKQTPGKVVDPPF